MRRIRTDSDRVSRCRSASVTTAVSRNVTVRISLRRIARSVLRERRITRRRWPAPVSRIRLVPRRRPLSPSLRAVPRLIVSRMMPLHAESQRTRNRTRPSRPRSGSVSAGRSLSPGGVGGGGGGGGGWVEPTTTLVDALVEPPRKSFAATRGVNVPGAA